MGDIMDDIRLKCDGCICDKCFNACSNCVRCIRAEYSEDDWIDYYCQGIPEIDCNEKE